MTDSGSLGAYSFAESACRAADRRLESEVRAAIEAGDIGALATRAYLPVAVRLLSHGIYSRVFADLLTGGHALPLRVMRGLQLGESHRCFTKAQTIRKLRAATGRNAEIIRALLTGEGDPAAVILRRLAEAVRSAALDVYDLGEAATVEPPAFNERSASSKRAARVRWEKLAAEKANPEANSVTTRDGIKTAKNPKGGRAKEDLATLRREARKHRAAVRAKADKSRRTRKRREDPDELSEALSFREMVARGER